MSVYRTNPREASIEAHKRRKSPEPAEAPTKASSALTVLECEPGRRATKRWHADGTLDNYDAGARFRVEEFPCADFGELVAMLGVLAGLPSCFVIRGAPKDDFRAELRDPELAELYFRRRKRGEDAPFTSTARHYIAYDFDDTAASFDLRDPVGAVKRWHASLPAELRAAKAAWSFTSKSHVSPTVRGRLWVWYGQAISEARANAAAAYYRADPSTNRAVQPIYTAAPIFEGCEDPLAAHRAPIVFDGLPGRLPEGASVKALRARPKPAHVPPLASLPRGAEGIIAALGEHINHVGRRFHMCGAIGGLMRKLGFRAEQCAAVVTEWLTSPPDPNVDVASGAAWAVGAWDHPADNVSGEGALAALLGDEHAAIVRDAALAARRRGSI